METAGCHIQLSSGSTDLDAELERLLEERDAKHKAVIAALEARFEAEIAALKSDIADLRTHRKHDMEDETKVPLGGKRAIAQTEVAFGSHAPDYDFSDMRAGKNLVYDSPFTNIGNAFNNSTGTFIAPVKGTYVLYAAVGGNLAAANYFYIDVNGVMMAKMVQAAIPGQSSNMVVVSLKPGDSVCVRSGRDHNGAYGGYFTTFTGFLLYESSRRPVVGK